MSERKVKPLARLEAKARQFMLIVGFGFIAYTGGTILSVMLMNRLNHRLVAADSRVLYLAVVIFVGQMWILFVLPALIHLASRFLELPIWRTAIVGALTGTLFNFAIRFVGNGVEQTFADPLQNLVWGGSLLAGIFFSVWAGRQGRAWADVRQKAAEQEAVGRKVQYDQFLAESVALAERREAGRAQAAAVPAVAAPVEAAPAAAAADPAPVDPKPPA
ncbi:MAG: hypothetical protein H6Q89_267 [Myxococcaceae bacterium]|nr:hypothetical protein [Myxococcaceae bacterium]